MLGCDLLVYLRLLVIYLRKLPRVTMGSIKLGAIQVYLVMKWCLFPVLGMVGISKVT